MGREGESLDLEGARFLTSAEGLAAARGAAAIAPDRRLLNRLRREHGVDRARALFELLLARAALAAKHSRAPELLATRLAAEQSSSECAARWRARRFADRGDAVVADLGCGVGIDALALAEGGRVLAIDADPVRARLARANLESSGAPGSLVVVGRIPGAPSRAPLVFADPDRRAAGRREIDPELGSPPLSVLLEETERASGRGIKLSPMARLEGLEGLGEMEFVSVGGELKELVLWTGALAKGRRRVSLPEHEFTFEGIVEPAPSGPGEPSDYLLDPDPGLIRSGLLGGWLGRVGGRLLDASCAYGTADRIPEEPLARAERIEAVLGPKPKDVSKWLRGKGIGRVDVSRRGFATSPEDFRKALRLDRGESGVRRLHLTRVQGRPVVLVTLPLGAEDCGETARKLRC